MELDENDDCGGQVGHVPDAFQTSSFEEDLAHLRHVLSEALGDLCSSDPRDQVALDKAREPYRRAIHLLDQRDFPSLGRLGSGAFPFATSIRLCLRHLA